MLAGADDRADIADYARAKEEWFRTFLELPGSILRANVLDEVQDAWYPNPPMRIEDEAIISYHGKSYFAWESTI